MKWLRLGCAIAAVFAAAGGRSRADVIFSTTAGWDGTTRVGSWGNYAAPASPTYGQTFVAPSAAPVLQSFTFYVQGNGASVAYQAAVYAWTGTLTGSSPTPHGTTGPALFTLSNQHLTTPAGNAFQAVTINTGGVVLTPGASYVALLTTADPASQAANAGKHDSFSWGLISRSHGANNGGGGFNYSDTNSYPFGTLNWESGNDYGDSAWQARFTAALEPTADAIHNPEPATLAVFGVLAAGAFGLRRRRAA